MVIGSPACRVIQPSLCLRRKGPKPFGEGASTLFSSQTSLRSTSSPIGRLASGSELELPKPTAHDFVHRSQVPDTRTHVHERPKVPSSIYRDEKMIKSWLCHHRIQMTSIFDLGLTVTEERTSRDILCPLTRSSLMLFDFASAPGPPRSPPHVSPRIPHQELCPHDQPETSPSEGVSVPSTPSISLDDLSLSEDEEGGLGMELRERTPLLHPSTKIVPKLEFDELSPSSVTKRLPKPTPKPIRNQISRSKLWDRKPKGLHLDLGALLIYHSYDRSCDQDPTIDGEESLSSERSITRDQIPQSIPPDQQRVPPNALQEYPFPRMDMIPKCLKSCCVSHPSTRDPIHHPSPNPQGWLSKPIDRSWRLQKMSMAFIHTFFLDFCMNRCVDRGARPLIDFIIYHFESICFCSISFLSWYIYA